MAKPFSIQSPEQIASVYGGNKQKIAQAMQTGIVDPTAGVLAGMFIDRMRAAQMQESMQKPTVAQQVMGGAPAGPQQAPPSPAGGLGATPQGAPPMAPPQGGQMPPPQQAMPPEMMQGAPQGAPPMGMADGGMVGGFGAPYTQGGLDGLPVPDTMFDENRNGGYDDGYAGGGLVAFADGTGPRGISNPMSDEEYINYILQHESRGRDYKSPGVPLRSPAGALFAMQVTPDTARDPGFGVTPAASQTPDEYNRVGRDLARALRGKYGDVGGLAAYNMGPGAYEAYRAGKRNMPGETQKYIADARPKDIGAGVPERNVSTAAGRLSSFGDISSVVDKLLTPTSEENEARAAQMELARKYTSPEYEEKMRKDSLWETLATIGFNMASSKSPYLLQAVGEAAAAALPGAAADKKERRALRERAISMMLDNGARDRRDALDKMKIANEVYRSGIEAEQFDKTYGQRQQQLKQEYDLGMATLKNREDVAKIGAESRDTMYDDLYARRLAFVKGRLAQGIPLYTANGKRLVYQNRPSDAEIAQLASDLAVADLARSRGGAGGTSAADKFAEIRGGSGSGSGGSSSAPIEGMTAKDTSGKTIVFQNGQWVYP